MRLPRHFGFAHIPAGLVRIPREVWLRGLLDLHTSPIGSALGQNVESCPFPGPW